MILIEKILAFSKIIL